MTQISNIYPQVGFGEAISLGFKKYVTFTGRARRSEYWWFQLFIFLLVLVTCWIPFINAIVYLGIILPNLAISVRRLHDTGRSGWWLLAPLASTMLGGLIAFVGVVGFVGGDNDFGALAVIGIIVYLAAIVLDIMLLIWCISDSKAETNQYGPSPKYVLVEEAEPVKPVVMDAPAPVKEEPALVADEPKPAETEETKPAEGENA